MSSNSNEKSRRQQQIAQTFQQAEKSNERKNNTLLIIQFSYHWPIFQYSRHSINSLCDICFNLSHQRIFYFLYFPIPQNLLNSFCFYFLLIIMKDKRGSHGTETSPQRPLKAPPSQSFTFKKQVRRTLGSEEDLDDKLTWNISASKMQTMYSPPKNNGHAQDIKSIIEENKKLKNEVKTLKQLLVDTSKYSKVYQMTESVLKQKKEQKAQQIQRLKKIIQKSYYSIKQMEQQMFNLSQKLANCNRNLLSCEKKKKMVQLQKQDLERKITNIVINHKKELDTCNERIKKLESWIEHLGKMIDQDRKNWNFQTQQLNNLKKFYFSRGVSL